MGLPEVGVGLIPGAHGTKEMLIRCTEQVIRNEEADYIPGIRHAWETIGLAKVSTSGTEAAKLRYVRSSETTLVLNRDWLLGEAKAQVLHMAGQGYRPRPQRTDIPAVGESGLSFFKLILHQMRVGGQISEHDQKVATKLAANPGGTLPQAFAEWAELKAAYRLFDNPHVDYEKVLQPHLERTRRLCREPGEYLIIEDTSNLDFSRHWRTEDLGVIGDGHGRGFELHSALAVRVEAWTLEQRPEGRVVGLFDQRCRRPSPAPKSNQKTTGVTSAPTTRSR